MAQLVQFSVDESIGLLRLNRPAQLNAMNRKLFAEFGDRLRQAAGDERLRVLVIAGNGRAFCAGTDIGELQGISAAEAGELALLENKLMNEVEDFPWPTIAAIHGYALGGGCELALACDLRVASADAQFGQPEIDMGWLPAAGATFRMPALLGTAVAKDLILTGRRLDVREAQALGLVQRVTDPNELMAQVVELARTLSSKDPAPTKQALKLLRSRAQTGRQQSVEREAEMLAECAPDEPAQARIRAFLKRSSGS